MANVQHNSLTGTDLHEIAGTVSGSDPGAVGAGKHWIDTSTVPYTLKRRNGADNGWLVIGGFGLSDPNADRVLFWDESAGAYAHLTMGTGLAITGTTLDASASGGQPAFSEWITGRYYDAASFISGTGGQAAVVANTIYASRIVVPSSQAVDRIAISVATQSGAGTGAMLGIYDDDGTDQYPGTLLYDEGEVLTDSTGLNAITISRTLAAGAYWVAALFESTPTVRIWTAVASTLGWSTLDTTTAANGISASQAYGALPGTFPGTPTYGNLRRVGLRAA